MEKMQYIVNQLKDPGSVRSLVLLLFIVKGQAVDNAMVEQIVAGVLALIAAVSFLIPAGANKTPSIADTVVTAIPAETYEKLTKLVQK